MISFFMGSCWLFISFVIDITNDLELLNAAGKSKSNQGRIKAMERFCNLVKAYINVKQLSHYFVSNSFNFSQSLKVDFNIIYFRCVNYFLIIYEFKVFVIFIWALLSISSTLILFMEQLVEYFHFIKKKQIEIFIFILFVMHKILEDIG